MVQGGMVLRTLDPSKRQELGLAQEDLGLVVHGLGEYGEHAAAKNAGFRKGDVVLTIQGVKGPVDESQLIGTLLELHPKSTQIRAKVLREKKRIELSWPIQ
jgi:S1-C subfamily serine protease